VFLPVVEAERGHRRDLTPIAVRGFAVRGSRFAVLIRDSGLGISD
jgi:hypothetical protein